MSIQRGEVVEQLTTMVNICELCVEEFSQKVPEPYLVEIVTSAFKDCEQRLKTLRAIVNGDF